LNVRQRSRIDEEWDRPVSRGKENRGRKSWEKDVARMKWARSKFAERKKERWHLGETVGGREVVQGDAVKLREMGSL